MLQERQSERRVQTVSQCLQEIVKKNRTHTIAAASQVHIPPHPFNFAHPPTRRPVRTFGHTVRPSDFSTAHLLSAFCAFDISDTTQAV
jgi:hypothetical protein